MTTFRKLAGALALSASVAVLGLAPAVTAQAKPAAHAAAESYLVYIGTYTGPNSKGIYAYRFKPATGALTSLGLIQEAVNPTWLGQHPNHRFLYSVNEHPTKTEPGNSITAYARDLKTGKLNLLNTVSSTGEGPAHLDIDKTGKIVAVANFITGSVATFLIKPDGSLSEAVSSIRQEGQASGPAMAKDDRGLSPTDSHNHQVKFSPDNRFLLVCNTGMGRVFVFKVNHTTGEIAPHGAYDFPGRSRHLAFSPNGKYVYIMGGANPVTTAAYDAKTGALKMVQSIENAPLATNPPKTLMAGSEVAVDPAGKFVYTSSRATNESLQSASLDGAINVFAVNAGTGKLTPVQTVNSGGDGPRSFVLDPTGRYLWVGNRGSSNFVVFKRNLTTGKLTPTGNARTDAGGVSAFVFEAEQ